MVDGSPAGERTNHEFLEQPPRPRARVVVLHRSGDDAGGAQVEFNSYGSPFHFDVELARQGCSVVYPAAPQTRPPGATAAPLLRPASPPTSDDDDGAPAHPPALPAETETLVAAATAAVRRAVDEDGIAADRVFVGGFDGGGAAALAVACQLDVAIGGYFCLFGGRGVGVADCRALSAAARAAPAARGVAVAFGRENVSASDEKNDDARDARLAASFAARGFAVETWDAAAAPADLDAQSGEGLVWAQIARAGDWVAAQLPKKAAAVARPKRPPRQPAPADSVDRTRVTYVLKTLAAGWTRAIFTVPDGAEELLAKYPIYCNNSTFDVKSRGPGRLGTEFVSPTPEATARTIAARLTTRLTDPGGTGAEEACLIS